MRRLIALAWLCTLTIVAVAQQNTVQVSGEVDAQRVRLQDARIRETARFDAADAECRTRFAVNDCLRTSQTKRRAVMSDLRKQEVSLNEQERLQRGQEQADRTAQKTRERQAQDKQVEEAHASRLTEAARKQTEQDEKRRANSSVISQGAPRVTSAAKAPSGPAAAEQAANRSGYESRQAEALQHKQDLIKRNADKTGKPASTLPLPP